MRTGSTTPRTSGWCLGVALRERRARPDRERGRPPEPRRAALPRLHGAADERGLPGSARAGHPGRGAGRAERRLRARHARSGCCWRRASPPLSSIEMDDRTDEHACADGRRRCGSAWSRCSLAWAVASLAGVPPLDRVIESERAPWLLVLLPFGVAAYAFAAWRYLRHLPRRAAARCRSPWRWRSCCSPRRWSPWRSAAPGGRRGGNGTC